MKADKIFLFFSDLADYYVRFWSRLFVYFNATETEGIRLR